MRSEDFCCVYAIRCVENNKHYIGATVNFRARKTHHISDLRGNKHHCSHLQRIYNKYGEEALEFIVLERCSPENVYAYERQWWLGCSPEILVSQEEPGGYRSGETHSHPNAQNILLVDTEGGVITTFLGSVKAAKELNLHHSSILVGLEKGRHFIRPEYRGKTRNLSGWLVLEENYQDYNDWSDTRQKWINRKSKENIK